MLTEKQIYEGKVFLRSYQDALLCIEQSVAKKATFEHYREIYGDVKLATDNKESMKLFRFSKKFLQKHFTPEPETIEDFQSTITKIKEIYNVIYPLISSYAKEVLPVPVSLPYSIKALKFLSNERDVIGITKSGQVLIYNIYSKLSKVAKISNDPLENVILFHNNSQALIQQAHSICIIDIKNLTVIKSFTLPNAKAKFIQSDITYDETSIICRLDSGELIKLAADDLKNPKTIHEKLDMFDLQIAADSTLIGGFIKKIVVFTQFFEKLYKLNIDYAGKYLIQLSYSGKILAICYECHIVFLYKSKLEKISKSQIDHEVIVSAFTKDEKYLIAATSGSSLVFIEVSTGCRLLNLNITENPLISIYVTNDNLKTMIITKDRLLTLNLPKFTQILTQTFLRRNTEIREDSKFLIKLTSPNKEVMIHAGYSSIIYTWRPQEKKSFKLEGHEDLITFLHIINESIIASGSNDNDIRLWNYNENACIAILRGHIAPITCLCSKNYWLVSGSIDQTIKIWHWGEFNLFHTINTGSTVTGVVCWDNHLISANCECVQLWDFQSFSLIGEKKLGCYVECLELVHQGKKLIVNKNKGLCIDNPLWVNELIVWGDSEYYEFLQYVYDILMDVVPEYNPKMKNYVFMPNKVSILHIYAYKNLPEHLEKSLLDGASVFNTSTNSNPLNIALDLNHQKCSDSIINSAYRFISYPFQFNIISLQDLLKANIAELTEIHKLYDMLWYQATHVFPEHCSHKVKLPISRLSDSPLIKSIDFIDQIHDSITGVELSYFTSTIPVPIEPGSNDSIEFMSSILKANENIYSSDLIKDLIFFKWSQISWLLKAQGGLYLIYYIFLILSIVSNGNQSILIVAVLLSGLISLEMFYKIFVTMNLSGWNIIDIFRQLIFIVYSIEIFQEMDTEIVLVLILVVMLSTLQGIFYFSIFKSTRLLVKNIVRGLLRLMNFISILIYVIGALSVVLSVTKYRIEIEQTRWRILNNYFVIILSLIMFCLLLSLSSYKYNVSDDLQEVAKIIVEQEKILIWKRNRINFKYFQLCKKTERVIENHRAKALKYAEGLQIEHREILEKFDSLTKRLGILEDDAKDLYSKHNS